MVPEKYPYPHHRGNCKLWRGGMVKSPGNSKEEGGGLTFLDSFTLGSKVCVYVHLLLIMISTFFDYDGQ